ncbi:putative flavin dependent monooxygenase [Hortaea werneckii]|nr:putative flavin dependent monooxygenase [Hortaea werneckii]
MGSLPAERRFKADSVCIIGAGPSGLAAAKYLLAEQAFSRVTIYEQRSNVGGIWNYVPLPSDEPPKDLAVPQTNPHAGKDEPIWQSSNASKVLGRQEKEEAAFMTPLYDRLETNIPRGLMGFSDLPWPEDCQLFPKHQEVLEYIERYSQDVQHLIHFSTQVLNVRLRDDERWSVKTQAVSRDVRGYQDEQVFDAVVVASGHFNVPYIPEVPGIEAWSRAHPGRITHSKLYRKPEHYAGKKVIVVGNSASGIDIGAQIEQVCQHPLLLSSKSESYLSNDPTETKVDKPPIAEFLPEGRSVRFEDGSVEADVDAVLYCTGYFYSFPFLDSLQPPLITTGERTENIYQHIFYQRHPSLAFPVLNQKVIPFPMAEAQCSVIARVLSGRLALPMEAEMKEWERQVEKDMGDGRMFHVLKFPMDADYINMCHDWALSADKSISANEQVNGLANGGQKTISAQIGKEPPFWDEKAYWTRERFPAIKKAFQSCGEDRHSKRSLEDVGFSYEQWKQDKHDECRKLI